jgi:MFS family permease
MIFRRMNGETPPSHGIAAYRRVLAAPSVLAASLATTLARIPVGMGAVALVLYVHQQTGSFAAAGAAAAAFTIGLGVTGPLLARVIDRRGPRPVLLPAAAVGSAAMAGVVALGEAGAGPVALSLAAAVAGAAMPPLGSVLRKGWPELVSAHDLPTAYAFDAVLIEVLFVIGRLLVGAALGLLGTLWFAALPIARAGGHPEALRPGAPRVLSSPAMRLLIFAGVPIGATFGALDVALPAFGVVHGSSALGGAFAAALALGSAAGGIVYGMRPHRLGGPARAFLVLRVAQVVTCLPMLLATSVAEMLAFAILSGICIAPLVTVQNQLVHVAMPAGTGTESFTWFGLSLTIGTSAGSALAGPLVQAGGWRAGVGLACLLPALGLLPLVLGRGALPRPGQEPAPQS